VIVKCVVETYKEVKATHEITRVMPVSKFRPIVGSSEAWYGNIVNAFRNN